MKNSLVKQLVEAPVPPIEDLVPEMIRIAEEGDIVVRVAKLLQARGYTSQDLWREVKKLNTVSSTFTTALQNTLHDLERGHAPTSFNNPLGGLRDFQRFRRRK